MIMKKRVRIIAISFTALFLSFCIPFVSICMETLDIYISPSNSILNNTTATSYTFYNVNDSSADFPPTFTNLYINLGDYNYGYYMVNGNSGYQFVFSSVYDIPDEYNSVDFYFVVNQSNYSNSIHLRFRLFGDTSDRTTNITLSFLQNQSFPRVINGITWNRELVYVSGPTGGLYVYKVSLFSEEKIISFSSILNYMSLTGYFLIPSYKMHYNYVSYTEWEKEQKEMHQQTLNEISQIGDDVSRVGEEVSKIGDEISQFHTDLTSYDESDAPYIDDGNFSQNMDDINSVENELVDFANSNDFTSYDLEGDLSDADLNFSWDEQTDGDYSFWQFVNSLWTTLHIKDVLLGFVPFAFIFIILKFFFGGIM